jgi:hypothetical protein
VGLRKLVPPYTKTIGPADEQRRDARNICDNRGRAKRTTGGHVLETWDKLSKNEAARLRVLAASLRGGYECAFFAYPLEMQHAGREASVVRSAVWQIAGRFQRRNLATLDGDRVVVTFE